MTHDYDDIINLPHHVSKRHPQMSMWNRAAQFAPFAALTGYDAAIQESGRQTDDWTELGEHDNEQLNSQLQRLGAMLPEKPFVTLTYFKPDQRKNGGSYQAYLGNVKRIDEYERILEMTDGTKIAIDSVTDIKLE